MNEQVTEQEKIRIAKREYHRLYRERNREKINARQREFYKNNKEKYKQYQDNHMKRKYEQLKAEGKI